MITVKKGYMLSNGVFLQNGDWIEVTFKHGEPIKGKIEYFTTNGIVLLTDFVGEKALSDKEITFNEFVKDVQLIKQECDTH